MKKLLFVFAIASLVLSCMTMTTFAYTINSQGTNGKGMLTATDISNGEINIKINATLYNDEEVVRSKSISLTMYGKEKPTEDALSRTIDGDTYYLYYFNQVATDINGIASFDFDISIADEGYYYFFLNAVKTDEPFKIKALLPPVVIDEKPMATPTPSGGGSSGGGGGGGGGGTGYAPFVSPTQAPQATQAPTPTPATNENKTENQAFSDLDKSHWAYENCMNLYNKGIIKGDDSGELRVLDNISREEISAVLVRAFNLQLSDLSLKEDNTSSSWAYQYLATLIENNIISQTNDGTYRGKSPATRAEVVTMLSRTPGFVNDGDDNILSSYVDYSEIPQYSREGFSALINKKIITGYEDNSLKPNNNISRAELFALISRIIKED